MLIRDNVIDHDQHSATIQARLRRIVSNISIYRLARAGDSNSLRSIFLGGRVHTRRRLRLRQRLLDGNSFRLRRRCERVNGDLRRFIVWRRGDGIARSEQRRRFDTRLHKIALCLWR